MQDERWRRARRIFERAVTLSTADQLAYIEAQCADDPELRSRIDRWLKADRAAEEFLEAPLIPSRPAAPEDDAPPRQLGPYAVLDQIGQGGMGTVYRARRDDGVFDRDVAVKILSRVAITPESERRFRSERRILAALDHPWIARVHDGGTTPNGRPYLVIEFVDGQPIDEYCDQHALSIRDRLGLYRKVCAAVQASHQALVVHCDLKPSNILVTADGEPKLLDFGIAKLLSDDGFTVRDEPVTRWPRPLTPQYASPEQLRGDVISTRSDVYSLGVLLYKLLTGQRPHELEGLTLAEAEKQLTREPRRPSQAAAGADGTPSKRRSHTPSQLVGDLDAIVLKALRADPAERYPSVEQLDADLGRHLDGFPVLARQGTLRYRAARFLRRHRLAIGIATAALVTLVAFATSMTVMAGRLSEERTQKQAVLDLVLRLFQTAGPVGEYEQVTLREAADRNALLIATSFTDQPDLRMDLVSTFSAIYLDLGDTEKALSFAKEARDLHAEHSGTDSEAYHRSLVTYGAAVREEEDDTEASKAAIQEALGWFRTHRPGDHEVVVWSLNELVATYCDAGDYEGAQDASEEAFRLASSHLGARALQTAAATVQRAVVLRHTGREQEASTMYQDGLDLYQQSQGADHPYQATLLNNSARIFRDLGQFDLAEDGLRAADAIYQKAFGDRSARRIKVLVGLADTAAERGDEEEAVARYRRAIRFAMDCDGHRGYPLRAAGDFAEYLLEIDRCQDGTDLMRANLDRTRAESADYWWYYRLEGLLGECLLNLGKDEEARTLIERSHRELVRIEPTPNEEREESFGRMALLGSIDLGTRD